MSEGSGLTLLSRQYSRALGDFLVKSDEISRLHAYELGRQALLDKVGLLDIVAVHHVALDDFLKCNGGTLNDTWLARASEFLGECLEPYEMSLRGYQEALRDLRHLNETLRRKNEEIGRANRELEAFSYSVAHDLRAPLRSIDGFSRILLRDNADELGETGREYLRLVRESAQRMGRLLEDMLDLARYSRVKMKFQHLDLASMARDVMERIRLGDLERQFEFIVPDSLPAWGDAGLLTAVLDNLLGNAWKYCQHKNFTRIEFGWSPERQAYFVRDNGAGFDMAYAGKLFKVFQRLHPVTQFEGTGVGLAVVERIVERHGGRIWANAKVDLGATFYFTLLEMQSQAALQRKPGQRQQPT